jgi:hypothetical protein
MSKSILVLCAGILILLNPVSGNAQERETILYDISPAGKAEYRDEGMVEAEGKALKLTTFRTRVVGFDDIEKIYSDPESGLPVRVERDIHLWTRKEYLVEEYDQKKFELKITKFIGGKLVKEYFFKCDGPIHNAILLPFAFRARPELGAGWAGVVRFPQEFKVQVSSVEEVSVPAGRFSAFHFTSSPRKFEIWLSLEEPRVPVRIKGLGGLGYTLEMRKHITGDAP